LVALGAFVAVNVAVGGVVRIPVSVATADAVTRGARVHVAVERGSADGRLVGDGNGVAVGTVVATGTLPTVSATVALFASTLLGEAVPRIAVVDVGLLLVAVA
jgi:hypothetical protein